MAARGQDRGRGDRSRHVGVSPCPLGSKLAFTMDHRLAGSVSGECVESAVIEAGLETLSTGRPRLLHFGVADETKFEGNRPRLRRADRGLRGTALARASAF
jgi:xanthine/CO dehydrogenase XdhC/CoxF family maturation factor